MGLLGTEITEELLNCSYSAVQSHIHKKEELRKQLFFIHLYVDV